MSSDTEPGIGSVVDHPDFGKGVVINIKPKTYLVSFIEKGVIEVAKSYTAMNVLSYHAPETDLVSLADVENILLNIIRKHSDLQKVVPLGSKWKGGMMSLQPHNKDLKPKEIPVETFFHKIVMLRDRLRVMEQRINASRNLDEEEKINLQQYITRIYGSLTTFNVLFENQDDTFVGEKNASG